MSSQTRSKIDEDNPNLDHLVTPKAETVALESLEVSNAVEFKAQPGTTAGALAAEIISHLNSEEDSVCVVSEIGEAEANKLEEEFENAGWRVKFEWDAETKEATVRMASQLHTAPLETFTHTNYNDLVTQLNAVAPCRHQKLQCGGDSRIRLENRSKRHPDGCFNIQEGPLDKGYTWNRVVIESLRSQPYKDAMKKVKELLTLKEGIHVVILLIYANTPKKGQKKNLCEVQVEVWTHRPTGIPGKYIRLIYIDYPLDCCPWSEESSEPKNEGPKEASETKDDRDGAVDVAEGEGIGAREGDVQVKGGVKDDVKAPMGEDSDGEAGAAAYEHSFASEASTKVDKDSDHPASDKAIRMRGEKVLVFSELKEDSDDVEEALYLDAYDFFRVCADKPEAIIDGQKRAIKFDLKPLQEAITAALRDERRELAEAEQVEEPKANPKRKPEAQSRPDIQDFQPPPSKKKKFNFERT